MLDAVSGVGLGVIGSGWCCIVCLCLCGLEWPQQDVKCATRVLVVIDNLDFQAFHCHFEFFWGDDILRLWGAATTAVRWSACS